MFSNLKLPVLNDSVSFQFIFCEMIKKIIFGFEKTESTFFGDKKYSFEVIKEGMIKVT